MIPETPSIIQTLSRWRKEPLVSFSSVVALNLLAATHQRFSRRFALVCFVVLPMLSASTAAILWWSEHKYEYIPKRWGIVVPGLIYRSGQLTPELLGQTLEEHGITTIIDLQLNDLEDPHLQWEMQYAAARRLRHFRFGLGGDGTGDVDRYVDAVAVLIECVRENQPVLVHCAAGTQRTGGVVACYRLLAEEAEPQEVYRELKKYDWEPGDDGEVVDYLNTHLSTIAKRLVERGVLAQVPAEIPQLGK